jgi:hypothetical protein
MEWEFVKLIASNLAASSLSWDEDCRDRRNIASDLSMGAPSTLKYHHSA